MCERREQEGARRGSWGGVEAKDKLEETGERKEQETSAMQQNLKTDGVKQSSESVIAPDALDKLSSLLATVGTEVSGPHWQMRAEGLWVNTISTQQWGQSTDFLSQTHLPPLSISLHLRQERAITCQVSIPGSHLSICSAWDQSTNRGWSRVVKCENPHRADGMPVNHFCIAAITSGICFSTSKKKKREQKCDFCLRVFILFTQSDNGFQLLEAAYRAQNRIYFSSLPLLPFIDWGKSQKDKTDTNILGSLSTTT